MEDITEAPEDITEDPVVPDSAVAIITGPRWVEECTTDLPWAEECTVPLDLAAEAAAAACSP